MVEDIVNYNDHGIFKSLGEIVQDLKRYKNLARLYKKEVDDLTEYKDELTELKQQIKQSAENINREYNRKLEEIESLKDRLIKQEGKEIGLKHLVLDSSKKIEILKKQLYEFSKKLNMYRTMLKVLKDPKAELDKYKKIMLRLHQVANNKEKKSTNMTKNPKWEKLQKLLIFMRKIKNISNSTSKMGKTDQNSNNHNEVEKSSVSNVFDKLTKPSFSNKKIKIDKQKLETLYF